MDLSETISPKSNQLNADDLITGPKKIRVTKVQVELGEQPVSIFFEGDNGKPFKPGKSMRRVLCKCWGTDGNQYAGREMVLYCDENVTWAGQKVGGIRISHLSHISTAITMPLTDKKGSRKLFKVNPLGNSQPVQVPPSDKPNPSPVHAPTTPQPAGESAKVPTFRDPELSALFAGNEAAVLAVLIKAGNLTAGQTLADIDEAACARLKTKAANIAIAAGVTLNKPKS